MERQWNFSVSCEGLRGVATAAISPSLGIALPFSIGDFDRAHGQEVCMLFSHRREYVLITDRVNEDCTPSQLCKAEPRGGDTSRSSFM